MVTLLGKIQGRLETRHQVEQRPIDRADCRRGRALELVEGHTRLPGRHCGHQIVDCLRLDEVYAPPQECPEGELAGFGQPGPRGGRRHHDLPQDHRASVTADFHDILAGVGAWAREVRSQHAVDGPLVRGIERVRQCGQPRLQAQPPGQDGGGDVRGAGSAHADDADSTRTRWRRNGHDRVVGGKHLALPAAPPDSPSLRRLAEV